MPPLELLPGRRVTARALRAQARRQSDRRKAFYLEHPSLMFGRKKCAKCKRSRHVTKFCIARRQPDGRHRYCVDCNRAHVRIWEASLKLAA